jgi:hypothetical protein
MCVGIGWTVPRLGGRRARRRFANRLLKLSTLYTHSTLLTSARRAVERPVGTVGATRALAPAAKAKQRIILGLKIRLPSSIKLRASAPSH